MEVQVRPGESSPRTIPPPPQPRHPKALRWEWKVVFISERELAGKERKLGAIDSRPQEKGTAQEGSTGD